MKRKTERRRGFVLIVVLALVAILAVVLVEFQYEARINLRTLDGTLGEYRALAAAEGGIEVAIAILRALDDTALEGPAHALFRDGLELSLGDATVSVRAVKENGKLNIATLVEPDDSINREAIDRFLALIDHLNQQRDEDEKIPYGIVPALIDWCDRNDLVTQLPFLAKDNRGAEDAWYRLNTAWPCKNGPLETMEELLLVKDITPEIYGGLGADEWRGRPVRPGLKDLTTIYGDGKVDLNHAPEPVIAAFSDQLDPGVAAQIVAYREEQPFTSLHDLRQISGLGPLAIEIIGRVAVVNPPDRYYRIEAVGTAGTAKRRIEAILNLAASGARERLVLRREY